MERDDHEEGGTGCCSDLMYVQVNQKCIAGTVTFTRTRDFIRQEGCNEHPGPRFSLQRVSRRSSTIAPGVHVTSKVPILRFDSQAHVLPFIVF